MAFRTTLSTTYRQALDTCTSLKLFLQQAITTMAAGPVSGDLIVQVHQRLIGDRARLLQSAAVNGISAYAKVQENDALYDVAEEFNSVISAVEAARDWIVTNAVTTGWATFSTSGISIKTFTSTQTAGLRTRLNAVVSTIA